MRAPRDIPLRTPLPPSGHEPSSAEHSDALTPPQQPASAHRLRQREDTVVSTPREEAIDCTVSNLPETALRRLIYINGIRTSEEHALQAAHVVRAQLGIEPSELKVLYNTPENFGLSALKIVGGILSHDLGHAAESRCVRALMRQIIDTIRDPNVRLTIVAHSQGTRVIGNALNQVFDLYASTEAGRSLWLRESSRIEVILYAPIAATLPPGPRAVGLIHPLDLPTRALGGVQLAVSSGQHLTRWRESQSVRTIVINIDGITLKGLLARPLEVHSTTTLMQGAVDFNLRILAADPDTGKMNGATYASNLCESIAHGYRPDSLHYALITKGCEEFGASFAKPFLQRLSSSDTPSALCVGKFMIGGEVLRTLCDP